MKKRIRIQIIGNYLNIIRYSLNRAGIYTEDILLEGNPLGFVSLSESEKKRSSAVPKEFNNINNIVTQLTLRKNLDEYLSHDENRFETNEIKHQVGKTVRYKNTSSFVIICNNNLVYPLFLYKGIFYSDIFPKNEFSEYLQQQGAVNVVSSPCFNDIRRYFDKYIEILLKEYDRKHIILIKTNPSLCYLENGAFKLFKDKILKLRDFIVEADNYFIEKTNCVVLNTFEKYVPEGYFKDSFLPCAFYPDFAYDDLSKDIITVIHHLEKQYSSVEQITDKSTLVKENLHNSKDAFLHFLIKKNNGSSDLSVKEINYIENYVELNSVDIDGLAGIFMLARRFNSHNCFRRIAFNLLHNNRCLVVIQSLRRYSNNINILNNYPFFRGNLPEPHGAYIKISKQYILGILPEQDNPFQLTLFINKETVNEKEVMDNGYCCYINEAEALCKSINFYVQRAKCGEGNRPVKLKYESEESFIQSMYLTDYGYLLSNEPFLIGLDNVEVKDFCVRTNLEFLFGEYSRIIRIRNGLSDQIEQFLFSKCIQSEGMDVYYDDLPARSINADHMGYELDKVIKEEISEKCFSNILSNALVESFDGHEMELPDALFNAGLYQLLAVSDANLFRFSNYNQCNRIIYEIKPENGFENLRYLIRGFGSYITYYYFVIRPEVLLLHYPLDLNQLCQFPEFEDELNSRLQDEINHCIAVGVHVRRGDFTLWGGLNRKYYREAICKIISIPEYSQARVYVFSDDIPWCRDNARDIGLSQINKERLTYISHNKGDESFRDMQLLTLCNVIIGQQGGFSNMAYALSDKSEMFVTPDKRTNEMFSKIGRKNKYDIYLKTAFYSTWQNSVEDDYERLKRELNNIKGSWSFRLGRIITYLPRKIRDYLKR